MALNNYTALQAAIASWLNRSDLTSAIPDYITLAESIIRREVESQNVTRNAAVSISAGVNLLPADVKRPIAIFLTDAGVKRSLELVTFDQFGELQKDYPGSGVPRYAVVYFQAGSTPTIEVLPSPSAAYTAELLYEPKLDPLATTNTNWLLTDHPDVYLYGALVEASPYLRDDPRVPVFQQRFDRALEGLRLQRDRAMVINTARSFPRKVLGG